MSTDYKRKITEISEMYQQANELVIFYETFNKTGKLSYVYQLKDAFNHLMDAVRAGCLLENAVEPVDTQKLMDDIESELEGCRKHLFRVIFDAGESSGLLLLKQMIKIFDRYPRSIVKKVYPKLNDEIRPQYLNFLTKLEALKKEKSSSSHKSVSDKMYKWVMAVKEFTNQKLEKNDGYKWSIFWYGLGWVASVVISAIVGWAINFCF